MHSKVHFTLRISIAHSSLYKQMSYDALETIYLNKYRCSKKFIFIDTFIDF